MINLIEYGFSEFYRSRAEEFDPHLLPARVTEVHRDLYKVICEFGEVNAVLAGSFYNKIEQSADFPAVGDFVMIDCNSQGNSIIKAVLERKSKFSRADYSGHNADYAKTVLEQVVAANFDYVFILSSLNHDLNLNRLQRYLSAAWQSGGLPVIVLTKTDLCENYSEQLRAVQKSAAGVHVIALSAHTAQGLGELEDYIKPGKTAVFLGSSGVGKSSLVNALAGEKIMPVKEIREDDSRGRHTTTHRQLITLHSGAMIIDTPGMRELGMFGGGEGLSEAYQDIEELFLQCKFSNCAHDREPGCAVKKAIANGTIPLERWEAYLKLRKEAKFTEDKAAFFSSKRAWQKAIAEHTKNLQKIGGKYE